MWRSSRHFHDVSVWADVEVLEAAVVASKDELEALCDDGPDGAVEHAPLGAEVGHVNTMWSIPTVQLHLHQCVLLLTLSSPRKPWVSSEDPVILAVLLYP